MCERREAVGEVQRAASALQLVCDDRIGGALAAAYSRVLTEPVPDDILRTLANLSGEDLQ